MSKNKRNKTSKKEEIAQRRFIVATLLARELSIEQITLAVSDSLKRPLSRKTIERDIAHIREENLKHLKSDQELRQWTSHKLSEYMEGMKLIRTYLWHHSTTFKSESARIKCLKYISESYLQEKEIIESLGSLMDTLANKKFRNMSQEDSTNHTMDEPTMDERREMVQIQINRMERFQDFPGKHDMLKKLKMYHSQLHSMTIKAREVENSMKKYKKDVEVETKKNGTQPKKKRSKRVFKVDSKEKKE